MSLIPKIKKDLKSFILEERGEISKSEIISFGSLLTGLVVLNIMSKVVEGAQISALHDHCDPGHSSVSRGGYAHSSADGVPAAHCSATEHAGWGHGNINAGHSNNIVLSYG